MKKRTFLLVTLCALGPLQGAFGQTAQVGTDREARGAERLRVDYVHYRPARWDTEHVTEYENEFPNQGGLLYFYVTNVGQEPVDLRFWRYNDHDESYWLLNHFIAWHRTLDGHLDPGETTVLEIDALTKDFALGRAFTFALVDATWRPCVRFKGTLREDPIAVSCIRVLPNMQELEVHARNTDPHGASFSGVEVVGRKVAETQWRGQKLAGVGHAIARVRLSEPLASSSLVIAKVNVMTSEGKRSVYAHRRAFADFFPIGTWGVTPETQAFLRQDHVDTVVKGGKRDDEFFGDVAQRFGFHAMVHTGEPVNVDMVRDLSGYPAVLCWMLRDEPDWSLDPQIMLFCDTTVRAYDATKPTYINLCRNAKFFEYAPISDIACHDHYCVTAPSSSKWPRPYGTYLEETGYYTKDLKYAAEPKPIWVWSQGNHHDWSERPKRPVPTPEELGAQLVLNLGRGAKGILWFTYNEEASKKYPDTRESMRGWNRVMAALRDDFLASEPVLLTVKAPEKVDVAALASWDTLILCVTNLDYEIHPEAYPFKTKDRVKISVDLPEWIQPKAAVRVAAEGVSDVAHELERERAIITMDTLADAAIVVLSNEETAQADYHAKYQGLLADESRAF